MLPKLYSQMGLNVRRILPKSLARRIYPLPDYVGLSAFLITHSAAAEHAFSDVCPHGVRQNASFATYRLFSSQPSNFRNPKKHSTVVSLLRNYGFSDALISSLTTRSQMFKLSAEKNLRPQLSFFTSIGLSNGDIQKMIVRCPSVILLSLQNRLIPVYDFLRDVPLDDKQVIRIWKWYPGILLVKVKTVLAPNLKWLRANGVTESSITSLMLRYAPTLCRNQEKFKAFFNQAVQSGFCPSGKLFIRGMHILSCLSKGTWENKVNLCKSFGLTDDDLSFLFLKNPLVMGLSEKNIAQTLKFFVIEHNLSPAVLARSSPIFSYSFERRVKPRCLVMDKLVEEGLARKLSPITFLVLSEEKFLERFIYKYKKVSLELLELYGNAMPSSSKTDA